jgi:hypothetical protein
MKPLAFGPGSGPWTVADRSGQVLPSAVEGLPNLGSLKSALT